jgi:DNA-directed RNA polymerase subunit RPC12/RpoP
LKYIWDTKEHKSGEEIATHKMEPTWACLRTEYTCIRDGKKWSSNPDGIFCEGSKVCLPYNTGSCEVCNDDLASKKHRGKLNFKCNKCNKEFTEPGAGFEIDHKKEYAEHLLTFGKCEDCGEELESVCKSSGTCPHVPSY